MLFYHSVTTGTNLTVTLKMKMKKDQHCWVLSLYLSDNPMDPLKDLLLTKCCRKNI